jgi:thymidylate kinase
MIYTLILILLSQHFYDVIIFDRSPIDTLVDIIADTRSSIETGILQKLFLSLLPRNSVVIILDIAEEIALTRKRDIPGKSYLSVRRRIYLKLAELYRWHVILTNENLEISTHSIESIISRMR